MFEVFDVRKDWTHSYDQHIVFPADKTQKSRLQ